MKNILLLIGCSLALTGCIGTLITGETGLFDEETPDITTVPCRAEAAKDRGVHREPEAQARQKSIEELETSKKAVKEQNQALRDKYF